VLSISRSSGNGAARRLTALSRGLRYGSACCSIIVAHGVDESSKNCERSDAAYDPTRVALLFALVRASRWGVSVIGVTH
jgi:hypothetical protein